MWSSVIHAISACPVHVIGRRKRHLSSRSKNSAGAFNAIKAVSAFSTSCFLIVVDLLCRTKKKKAAFTFYRSRVRSKVLDFVPVPLSWLVWSFGVRCDRPAGSKATSGDLGR